MEKYAPSHPHQILKYLIILLECSLVFLAIEIAFTFFPGNEIIAWKSFLPFVICFDLSWIALASVVGHYNPDGLFHFRRVAYTQLNTLALQVGLVLFLIWAEVFYVPNALLINSFILAICFVFSFRFGLALAYKYRRLFFNNFDSYRVVIVGSGRPAQELRKFFRSSLAQVYHFQSGAFREDQQGRSLPTDKVDELKAFCLQNQVNEIYYTLSNPPKDLLEDIADFAEDHYIQFNIANDFNFPGDRSSTVHFFGGTPVISLRKNPQAFWINRITKRLLDIAISFGVVAFVLPIMYLVVGALIKLESRGPVLYRQDRAGRKNRPFKCYKFRTMRVAEKTNEFRQATRNDPRITRIGAFLRRTSLDEFPQFINVLLGDMSIVGPRPHPIKLNEQYAPLVNKYQFRYSITPGITGYAQVHGYRGETKTSTDMEKRVEHDIWYIENWSLMLDIKILFSTFFSIFKKTENAY